MHGQNHLKFIYLFTETDKFSLPDGTHIPYIVFGQCTTFRTFCHIDNNAAY